MYILIAADGKLSLQESDNMRAFSIVEAIKGAVTEQLLAIATPADKNHYWLDANAMIELSGRKHDQVWVRGFWEMLAKVEAYGYSDMAKKRVKAHMDLA
jgi:hypothetical protein